MLNPDGLSHGRKLQAHILHGLLQGRAPDRTEFQRSGVPDEILQAWEELIRSGAVIVNTSGRVIVAYPLSAVQTSHNVEVGSFAAWADCAIDALAVPYMVGRPGWVNSTCAHCGVAITIEVADENIRGTPQGIVVGYGGLADCCDRPAIEARCPYINFFCGQEHASSWVRPKSWVGEFLSLTQAHTVAVDRFRSIIEAYRSIFSIETSLPARGS